MGDVISIILSNFLCLSSSDFDSFFSLGMTLSSLNLVRRSIQEYSKTATVIKNRHDMIHITWAFGFPPDLGDIRIAEFRVLIKQRDSVSKSPSLAGMAPFGTTKLT